jgi:GDPmannose 4,6-dehydratase
MKKALIIGVNGQDGSYLAKFLLEKGYHVVGTSRDIESSSFSNLLALGIKDDVVLRSMSLIDFRSVIKVIFDLQPDEIYNLGGQTSVGLSFEQPIEAFESITLGTLNLLEVLRLYKQDCKLYNASSSECFGNTFGKAADESSIFKPLSPYGVAKCAAFWQVENYKDGYNLFCCSGILFNHESPLRPGRFVTQKIIKSAVAIQQGKMEKLRVGNIDISRDWGWAPEFVEAMYLMLQQPNPDDYVIATGESLSLRKVLEHIFGLLGMNYLDYIIQDQDLLRPNDIPFNQGNYTKAREKLAWQPQIKGLKVFEELLEHALKTGK